MAAKTTAGPGPEMATMKALTQQSAAWLLGVTPRSLRDSPALERNADGSYDGRAVVEFARRAGKLPTLDDHQYESALLIADKLPTEHIARIKPAVDTLVREIGGDPLAALAAVALVLWNDKLDMLGQHPEQFDFGPRHYDTVHVCDGRGCGKYRLGRRWIKAEPPEGQPTIGALCPTCQRSFGRARVPVIDADEIDDEMNIDAGIIARRKGRR